MKLLNDEFDEYRDCLRMVWNFSLRHRRHGTVSHDDVSRALLGALVLDDLVFATDENTRRNPDGSLPSLGVALRAKAPILVSEDTAAETVWKIVEPRTDFSGGLFLFVDVFDFHDFDQTHEYEYVKAIAAAPLGSIPKDTLVLLRRCDVDIVDLTEPG